MSFRSFIFFLIAIAPWVCAGEIQHFDFKPCADMERAALDAVVPSGHEKAILIVCPGVNGSGERVIRQGKWQAFARCHQLGLVGLSFASKVSLLQDGRGYYYASQGSGQLLLDGLRKIYGKDLPVLLYGISGGAHFTSRFVEWSPKRVVAWCAYSAAWWDDPKDSEQNPPGLVACGDQDARYGASLMYFKQGRALGKPWLWISLPGVGHQGYPPLEDFVREYFLGILDGRHAHGGWVDVDLKTTVDSDQAVQLPSLTAWLPDINLLDRWKKIHTP